MTTTPTTPRARLDADLQDHRGWLAVAPAGPSLDAVDDACQALKQLLDAAAERGHYLTYIVSEELGHEPSELAAAEAELAFHREVADIFVGWFEGDAANGLEQRASAARGIAHALMGTEKLRRSIQVARISQGSRP